MVPRTPTYHIQLNQLSIENLSVFNRQLRQGEEKLSHIQSTWINLTSLYTAPTENIEYHQI